MGRSSLLDSTFGTSVPPPPPKKKRIHATMRIITFGCLQNLQCDIGDGFGNEQIQDSS